jgi:flavin-dependent dehydrogenase
LNDALFDPDGDGLHLDRGAFDGFLAARAQAAGVEVEIGQTVQSCRRVGQTWVLSISGAHGVREFLASTLIDAAGRAHWPGRPSRRKAFDRQVAMVALIELAEPGVLDRRTWVESVRDGWWYSAIVPGGHLIAAYFTDSDLLHAPKDQRARRFHELLDQTRWTRERLEGGRTLRPIRVVSAASTIAVPVAGAGWVAVGDAASTVDPLSSQGILYALASGLNAAEALTDPEPFQARARYVRAVTARFQADLGIRTAFCRRERRWPDSSFWRRRARLPSAAHFSIFRHALPAGDGSLRPEDFVAPTLE